MIEEKLVHFVEWKKVADADLEKTMHDVRSWGVTDIVAHPIWWYKECENKGYLKRIASMLKAADLKTPACHALWGLGKDLACNDESQRLIAMENHKAFLYALAEMGVSSYTLHLGLAGATDLTFARDQIRRSVDALLPVAQETSIALALENSGESLDNMHYVIDLVASYADPVVGLCFDTGHANYYPEAGLFELLELMKKDMVTCHMHDNYGTEDDHNPPGEGNIPWGKLVAALKACPRMHHAETESGNWSHESWDRFYAAWNQ